MNPLSIFNAAARATGAQDSGYVAPEPAGQDDGGNASSFARMLDPAARGGTEATQPRRSDAARPERARDRRAEREEPAQDRDHAAHGGEDTTEATRAGRSAEPARASQQAADAEAATAEQDDPATAGDEEAAWPPPGLGGFGLLLTAGVPAAPAPAGPATAAFVPGALPGAGSAAAAAAGPAPVATPAAGNGLPALAAPAGPAGTATSAPASAPAEGTQALAALAAAALASQGRGHDPAGADPSATVGGVDAPGFMLPTAAAGPARAHEPGAVFTASPTPTPNLRGEGFDDAVATRVAWLADQKIGHAHIKITPNDLGPVEVQLKLDGDKVQANFTSAHADVRQALEQSLPRLRDMLGQHGFQLTHSDVGAQHQGQRGGAAGQGAADGTGLDALGSEETAISVPASVLRARGLLDAYA